MSSPVAERDQTLEPAIGTPKAVPWRRPLAVKLAFWGYALALFTATHWPRLEVPGPEGSDKVLHLGAFGTWMLCATAYAWFARPLSTRNLLLTYALALVYAAIDEGLQEFEFIHRTASLNDYAANAAGITLALIALFIARPVLLRLKPLQGFLA